MTKRIQPGIAGRALRDDDLPASAKKAGKHYKLWHQKQPESYKMASYTFPKKMTRLGRATNILYFSDKWEDDGKGYEYTHDFTSKPDVYASPGLVKALGIAIENPKSTDTQRALKCSPDGDIPMSFMALALEMTVDCDGEDMTIPFGKASASVWCLPDRKGVLIFVGESNPQCLIIRGGRMVVTERGIVR